MKSHPLEIHDFYEFEGPQIACYSKGHHNFEEFIQVVRQHVNPYNLESIDGAKLKFPRHEHWRFVPFSDPGYQKGFYQVAVAGTKGAFPVTVADIYD